MVSKLMRTVTHKANSHTSTFWPNIRIAKKKYYRKHLLISYVVRFTKNSIYSQLSGEQDWNKLCGISFSPIFKKKRNMAMVGWRYNHDTQTFQLTPYLHDNTGMTYGKFGELPVLDVPSDTMVYIDFYVDYDSKQVIIEVKKDHELIYNPYTKEINPVKDDIHHVINPANGMDWYTKSTGFMIKSNYLVRPTRIYRTINPYFGGTYPPKETISFYLDRYSLLVTSLYKDTNYATRDYSLTNLL